MWNRIPDDVRDKVVKLSLDEPDLSPREMAVRFTVTEKYFVSEASVYRILKAHDLITSPAFIVVKVVGMASSSIYPIPQTVLNSAVPRISRSWQLKSHILTGRLPLPTLMKAASMPVSDKTFILGVGAQKAGTTWLSTYLSSSGQAATFERVKEYHVWDALYIPLCKNRLVAEKDRFSRADWSIRYHLQQSPENYFDFFNSLMTAQSKVLTYDISPSYAGLSRDVFEVIQRGFTDRGVFTKCIFLMRDPVERCWSSARKGSLRRSGSVDVSEEQVLTLAATAEFAMRTRYDITMAELEAAFEPGRLYCDLYEQIFMLKEVDRLSAFCKVEARPTLLAKSIFASEKKQQLSDQAFGQIATLYRPVYDYVAKKFPSATDLWPGYRYL